MGSYPSLLSTKKGLIIRQGGRVYPANRRIASMYAKSMDTHRLSPTTRRDNNLFIIFPDSIIDKTFTSVSQQPTTIVKLEPGLL
jgi:hypothetical protein